VVAHARGDPANKKMHPSYVGTILREDLHLTYRRYDGATARYQDPSFDPKRQAVSRVLGQFLLDEALVISIDESHLRSDAA